MYELKPTERLNWSFEILQDGRPAGSLALRLLKPSGTLQLDDKVYEIKREGLFGAYVFTTEGREVARAEKESLLRARYVLKAEDRELLVSAKGFLQRMAQVLHGDVVLATIHRTSLFRREVKIDIQPEAPAHLVMFATTLMLLFWRHQSRSR
jgi:hypothetical protein